MKDGRVILAQDLRENLTRADKFEDDFVKTVDEFIAKNGLDAREEVFPNSEMGITLNKSQSWISRLPTLTS